jgi:hypothetical protein
MNMCDKILLLPALGIIAEMAVDTAPDIDRFSYVNDLSFGVMKIINPGRGRQRFKMLLRYIGR